MRTYSRDEANNVLRQWFSRDRKTVTFWGCGTSMPIRAFWLLTLGLWGLIAPVASFAAFPGKMGYTVVFAFSESTGRYGWGWNVNPDAAAQTALQGCGVADAKVVCFKKDGFLCLVWDGSKFAFGHDIDSAQNAVGHAEESFANIHGGSPSNYQCRSSDGNFIPVR